MTNRKEISKRKPIKLEDLQKDRVFQAPEGYFDKLPGEVQARISQPEGQGYRPVLIGSLKYALPVLLLLVVVHQFDLFEPEKGTESDPIALIDQVSTEDLIAYLDQSDISEEEILEQMDLNNLDFEFNDPGVLLLDDNELVDERIEEILEEYDIEGEYL